MCSRKESFQQRSKFKRILEANGINDEISEVIISDSGLRGENFASDTQYVTITFSAAVKKSPLDLFVKKKTTNPAHSNMLEECRLFEKEAIFFLHYLKAANNYCQSVGMEDLMKIYPKCYYGDNEFMVFENLVKGTGFFMIRKELQQDFEAAKFALCNLAKHHAISHALIQEEGGIDKFFDKYPSLKFEGFLQPSSRAMAEPSFENGINTCIQILEKSSPEENHLQIKTLKSMQGKALITEAIGKDDRNYLLLLHGDYWNNNMLFLKNSENDKITDQVLLDFQLVRCGSPGFDLAYYLFTSVKGSVRRKQFRELLQYYLKVLKETTERLHYPIQLTIEELETDYCQNFKLGFYFGLTGIAGPGYSVLKDIDMDGLKDIGEWAARFDELVQQWIEENPEKCTENVINIRDTVDEYQCLISGQIK